jgi:hypothetical protein
VTAALRKDKAATRTDIRTDAFTTRLVPPVPGEGVMRSRHVLPVMNFSMEECVMRSTKFLAAAAVITVTAPAFAQDMMSSDSARIVSDPLYLPLQGEIYGATGYQYGSLSRDTYNAAGVKTDSANVGSNTLDQTFLYGITDDLAVHFDWGYDISRDASRHVVGGDDVKRDSSGWTNPDFGLIYRVMDQRDNPLTLDLRADYSPDAFPAKSATGTDEGTVASGGQMADFGATLGHEGPMFTVAAKFDAIWLDTRNILNQSSGDVSRYDSVWNYRFGLDSQTRITDQFSFNAGVGHTFTNSGAVFNQTNGLEHITTGGDVTDVNAALNYQFVPNTVVGSLEYQHNFYQNSRDVFALALSNTSTRNKDEDLVGVTVRYVLP